MPFTIKTRQNLWFVGLYLGALVALALFHVVTGFIIKLLH